MNAILQCLINIEIFSAELTNNCPAIELLKKYADEQDEASSPPPPPKTHEWGSSGGVAASEVINLVEEEDDEKTDDKESKDDKEKVKKEDSVEASLYSCLCELLKACNDSLQMRSLKKVKNAISAEATRFSGYQQNDAHEFLCQVLDQLKDDFTRFSKMRQVCVAVVEAVPRYKPLLELSWINPIEDTFQFVVRHSIECKKLNSF
jgi:uncharacterized UBP type Zn finger protein